MIDLFKYENNSSHFKDAFICTDWARNGSQLIRPVRNDGVTFALVFLTASIMLDFIVYPIRFQRVEYRAPRNRTTFVYTL